MTNATSSPVSAAGRSRYEWPVGPSMFPSGRDRAHASPLAPPAKAKRSTIKGTYGPPGTRSSKHEDLSFALASRLRPLTDSLGSTLFSLTWMKRATPAGRWTYALRASAPRTEGSVFIGWPTPQKHDERERGNTMEDCHYFPHDLSNAATMAAWPTPNTPSGGPNSKSTETHTDGAASLTAWGTPAARDWKNGDASQETLDKNARPLSEQVILAGWPTPMKQDENQTRNLSPEAVAREINRKGGSTILATAVTLAAFADPLTAFGDQPIGYLLGPSGWEIVPASGQLNAAHSRWLMGLPPEWDDCGVTVMPSSRKSRRRS